MELPRASASRSSALELRIGTRQTENIQHGTFRKPHFFVILDFQLHEIPLDRKLGGLSFVEVVVVPLELLHRVHAEPLHDSARAAHV